MQLSQSELACMWNLWWVSQQQLDCKSFVEALARIKTAKCTYRTFVKSSLIDSRESNVPTRRSGIWNCCDIQPRGRRQKVSSVHNTSYTRKITQEAIVEQNQRNKRKKKWKQNQAPKWNYCCNDASCTLLTSDATHFVNRDIECDVRDALVKIAPCCVRGLSIQQRQWYQDILQSCHCTRSLSLSPSNSSSKSHTQLQICFLREEKEQLLIFFSFVPSTLFRSFLARRKREEDRIFFGHSSFQAHYCDLFFRLVQCFLSDHISCEAFAFL